MGNIAKDINKITGVIIGISGKLILYALIILLLAEGVTRGYAFGHEIFYAKAMEAAPGHAASITIPKGQKSSVTISQLKDLGLIDNELAIQIQMKFYEYKIQPGTYELSTSMTSKEILQTLNQETEEADVAETAVSAETGDSAEAVETVESSENTEGLDNAEGFDDSENTDIEIEVPEGGAGQ